jgi:hypothetical protein
MWSALSSIMLVPLGSIEGNLRHPKTRARPRNPALPGEPNVADKQRRFCEVIQDYP